MAICRHNNSITWVAVRACKAVRERGFAMRHHVIVSRPCRPGAAGCSETLHSQKRVQTNPMRQEEDCLKWEMWAHLNDQKLKKPLLNSLPLLLFCRLSSCQTTEPERKSNASWISNKWRQYDTNNYCFYCNKTARPTHRMCDIFCATFSETKTSALDRLKCSSSHI